MGEANFYYFACLNPYSLLGTAWFTPLKMKLIKTLRNNWKKSIFFTLASFYGGRWGLREWEDEELRREFCNAANAYGQEIMAPYGRLRHVTVLLNPAAGDNSSRKQFEKNVAPLLHLAGLDVHIVKTEFEGQATGYMDVIEKGSTDAVILVGGSGLVMEAVTGLLRRPDSNEVVDAFPLGIIPTGNRNTFVKALLSPLMPRSQTLNDVKFMGEAAMAIIRGKTRKIDVLKIEAQPPGQQQQQQQLQPTEQTEDQQSSSVDDVTTPSAPLPAKKTIYAIAGLEWGMHRQVVESTEKYWYYGRRLKAKVAYLFSTMTFSTPWPKPVSARVQYVDSCRGCSTCLEAELAEKRRKNREAMDKRSLFQKIFTTTTAASSSSAGNGAAGDEDEEEETEARRLVTNPECGVVKETQLDGSQIVAAIDAVQNPTPNGATSSSSSSSAMNLYSLPTPTSRWNFIADGWKRVKERTATMGFEALEEDETSQGQGHVVRKVKEFYLEPLTMQPAVGEEEYLSVDDEQFEVMPMHVALMKRRITCFSPQ